MFTVHIESIGCVYSSVRKKILGLPTRPSYDRNHPSDMVGLNDRITKLATATRGLQEADLCAYFHLRYVQFLGMDL